MRSRAALYSASRSAILFVTAVGIGLVNFGSVGRLRIIRGGSSAEGSEALEDASIT